jgi:Protein of unknown function (DUF2924)
MARKDSQPRSAALPTATDVDAEVGRIASMSIEALRALWSKRRGGEPPATLSKDLIARALSHWLQEQNAGGLSPQLRRLLTEVARNGAGPVRHLKIGSVIVREHQGVLHEVMVAPDGFCWQGKTYSSLSTIALKITGTSWNGPRFFGLRDAEEAPLDAPTNPHARTPASQSSIKARPSRQAQSPAARRSGHDRSAQQ